MASIIFKSAAQNLLNVFYDTGFKTLIEMVHNTFRYFMKIK